MSFYVLSSRRSAPGSDCKVGGNKGGGVWICLSDEQVLFCWYYNAAALVRIELSVFGGSGQTASRHLRKVRLMDNEILITGAFLGAGLLAYVIIPGMLVIWDRVLDHMEL
ncbi:MAG: hypothetical protein WC406_06210 [Methanoregula sp.]|jgi:hypothetical protein|nr:hypothetical protein [Methanoregula sp.]